MSHTTDTVDIRAIVGRVVAKTPVTDLHTHLYAPAFGPLLLWGIDEMLTYHYLAAEVLRVANIPYDAYWALPKKQQAELIWRELFIERSPVGEACRGVLTTLDRLGLDVAERDLNEYRNYFADQRPENHVDTVLKTANLKCVVMTNDVFDSIERPVWLQGFAGDKRFHAALRLDTLLNDWGRACPAMREWGYDVEPGLSPKTLSEVRRFLNEWLQKMGALYMAASFAPDFAFPEDSPRARLIESCVLPAGRDAGVPFAMMIGVKRNVNPALKLAGDGVGFSDIDAVARLCAEHPDNRFMVTMLARENQHELCVTARKFRNLLLFGCWWFLNNPSLIKEMTRMRMELLGLSFVPQHSDARVLDQVIYKWEHSRAVIAKVLASKYADLVATGWQVTESEIARDAARLLDRNFWDFLGRS